jgi:uncharacterized protein (UPF0332 family)
VCPEAEGYDSLPQLTTTDSFLLFMATLKKVDISDLPTGRRYPLPLTQMVSQIVSDRLSLAGSQLATGDKLVFDLQYRASISRHYYAMYHAARAITFAFHGGDDHQAHSTLPRNLPSSLADVGKREIELTDARLLRNLADYDPYPTQQSEWQSDARSLSVIASEFCQACDDFALQNGYI